MDPVKTGTLIRALRKERNMTQKDLAEHLHITDRAVSKWERGLCAPDISKYVIALQYDSGTYLALSWLDRHVESNLNAYLSMGVKMAELRKDRYVNETGFPEIQYRFLQWGLDSASMLIYYAFEDSAGTLHDGYFWYNCDSGAVDAILELNETAEGGEVRRFPVFFRYKKRFFPKMLLRNITHNEIVTFTNCS